MEMEKVKVYFIPNLKHHCNSEIFLENLMETEKNTIILTLGLPGQTVPGTDQEKSISYFNDFDCRSFIHTWLWVMLWYG